MHDVLSDEVLLTGMSSQREDPLVRSRCKLTLYSRGSAVVRIVRWVVHVNLDYGRVYDSGIPIVDPDKIAWTVSILVCWAGGARVALVIQAL